MNTFVIRLLYGSCSMAIVALLYILAGTFLKEKYSAKSFYCMGICILLGFLFPFRPSISIPRTMEDENGRLTDLYNNAVLSERILEPNEMNSNTLPAGITAFQIIFVLWIVGIILIVLYYGIRHVYFVKTVKRWSIEVTEQKAQNILTEIKKQVGVKKEPELRSCSLISSPMLVHQTHPMILFPDMYLTEDELRLVIYHEMVHLGRKDLMYKKGLLLAVAVNWFNPVVYLFAKVFMQFCEMSCDEAVTEGMNEGIRCQYAKVIMRAACKEFKLNTVFSTFFDGGKKDMRDRIFAIFNNSKKQLGAGMLIICLVLTLGSGTVFASSGNNGGTMDEETDSMPNKSLVKTSQEIELEIEEAFSEEFSNEFNEEDFPGMIITYDENGIPIVTDPNPPATRAVHATTRYEKNGFYSSSDCSDSNLVFYILKNMEVEVLDSAYTTTVAKVKYAGSTGYMKKSDLKF